MTTSRAERVAAAAERLARAAETIASSAQELARLAFVEQADRTARDLTRGDRSTSEAPR